MRRLIMAALVLVATSASAQIDTVQTTEPFTAYMFRVYYASPMRTIEQAEFAAGTDGMVIPTNNPDAPYLVISSEQAVICARLESIQAYVADYMRDANRSRPYLIEVFNDRQTAEQVLAQLQADGFYADAMIVDAREGGALLVYRNPMLQ